MARLIDITGKAISGEWGDDDLTGEGIPVLRTTNFTNEGIVNYANTVTRNFGKKDISKKYLRLGDIIIEKSGGSDNQPVGRVIYFDGPENTYLFNNFTGLLRVNDTSTWISRYVFYALFANYQFGGTRRYENRTTGLHNLQTDAYVASVEIKDLPIKEQQKIVDILDKLTTLISFRRQQLAKLDELVKARFVEMFGDLTVNPMGWKFQKLSSLCDVRDGTHDSPEYQNEGYPLLTSKNFSSGIIDFSDCNLISEEDFEMINRRSKVDLGDIIMPMIGTIGHPVIVDTNRPFAIKNVALIKFNGEDVSNIFVKTVLDSDYFLNMTTANNRGGTQKFIALGDIRNIPIPIVPKECQAVFAGFVGEVARQKLTIQQSLDKLEVLKKKLMQEYFG